MADDNQLEQRLQQADHLRLSGDYEKAIELLLTLCQDHPFFSQAKLLLGRAYFESGKLNQALPVLEEFVEFVPEHVLANKILAKIYVFEKKFSQAQEKIQLVLVQNPQDPVALKLQKDIPTSIIDDVESDETIKTTMPTLTPTMAELYYHQGHIEEARKIYEKLLLHDPTNRDLIEKMRLIDQPIAPAQSISSDPKMITEAILDKSSPSPIQESPPSQSISKLQILEQLLERVQMRKFRHV